MSGVGAETRALAPLPRSLAWAERIVATSSTPGTLRAAVAVPFGIGEKPSLFWITRPPAKFSSTTWATELFSPAEKTVTKATSARPIISAAAVTAVRLGLRWAFSRASRPSRRRTRSSGQPATAASGGTRRGLKSETAITITTAPPPISPARGAGVRIPEQADQDHRQADQRRAGSRRRRKTSRRRRVGVGTKACRAAIGGTRVERRAGISEETRVTRIADQQRDDDRAGLHHQAGGRQVDFERFQQRLQQQGDEEAAGDRRSRPRARRSPAPRR